MTVVGTTYCLGVGCMDLCKTCRHDRNWQALNRLDDAEFQAAKASMSRANESLCQLRSGSLYLKAEAST